MINKKGFTLIELLVAITIIVFLTLMTYAPFNHYSNKAKLKVTTREVSQLLYESRNMAINGSIQNSGNVSIGVYLENSTLNKGVIKIFSYPHNIDHLDIVPRQERSVKLIKTINLQKGVEIDSIDGKDNMLFVFDAITGNLKYYSRNGIVRSTYLDDIISIDFSYKGSTSETLKKTINYFTNTNIIDY